MAKRINIEQWVLDANFKALTAEFCKEQKLNYPEGCYIFAPSHLVHTLEVFERRILRIYFPCKECEGSGDTIRKLLGKHISDKCPKCRGKGYQIP